MIRTKKYCKKCKDYTGHYKDKHKFNWPLHFVLFIFTGLLWLVPFLFYYMAKKDELDSEVCKTCGTRS